METSNQKEKNLKVYLGNRPYRKDPRLKLRYSKGLGDIVACLLHSRLIGWFVHLVTGNKTPCTTCWSRANAMNVVLPIPLWRLFFKNTDELIAAFKNDMEESGFYVIQNGKSLEASRATSPDSILNDPILKESIKNNISNQENELDNYLLLTSNDNYIGEFMIRNEIYKKK